MMKQHLALFRILAALAVAGAPARALAQAVVEGKVTLPKPAATAAKPPRYQGQAAEVAPPDPPVAVVYLEGKFPATTNAPKAELWQKGLQFRPGVLPVQVGATVEFPNGDDLYHNVFSYSKTKRFDLGRYRKDDKPASQTFDKPGVVKLYCEIHEHMRGYIVVLDTPHFTTTDTNGVYRLENLPAGKYTLKAWVDEKTTLEKTVELETGKPFKADFTQP